MPLTSGTIGRTVYLHLLWNQGMNIDVDHMEVIKLEETLNDFKQEWEIIQNKRSNSWRKYFVICFICALIVSLLIPSFWWCGIFVIGYFAGSLFAMLRQNAKTSSQIVEHQNQLKLVKLLRNFESSPFSER